MSQENIPDAEVESWLEILGVKSLCQWDLLVFLYRHQTSLVGADYLARLLGYATESVMAAMDTLESLGLVGRSRVSQGARFYQFMVPSAPPHGEAFTRLLALANHRAGRLRLSKQLRQNERTPEEGLQAARHSLAEAKRVRQAVGLQSPECEGRRERWLKAI
jgi:DNA-binding MarR family transcriptional regulator